MRQFMRTWLAATAALLVVVGTVWVVVIIHSVPSQHPSRGEVAGEWQGYLAPVAIAVGLLGAIGGFWWRGRRLNLDDDPVRTVKMLDRATDQLARQILNRCRQDAHRWGLTNVAPIAVTWKWNRQRSLPTEELFAPGKAPNANNVLTMYDELLSRLLQHRLVILGEPGAGKSGTLELLLITALERREAIGSGSNRARVATPVLVGLAQWRPSEQSLSQFISEVLTRDYPALRGVGREATQRMIEDQRLRLFLDGFDEIPPDEQAKALARIDKETTGLELILTSRPEPYIRASTDVNLAHAAVINLSPVSREAATTYLTQGHSSPELRESWRKFSQSLASRPESAVAKTLRTPLFLTLVRSTYSGRGAGDLPGLLKLGRVREVKTAVVGAFLAVAYPDRVQRENALHWLGWIALNAGPSSDLRWWDVPGWVPGHHFKVAARWALGTIGAIGGALVLLVAGEHKFEIKVGGHSLGGIVSAMILGAVVGMLLGLMVAPLLLNRRESSKQGPLNSAIRWPSGGELIGIVLAGVASAAVGACVSLLAHIVLQHYLGSNRIADLSAGAGACAGFAIGAAGRLIALWVSPSDDLESVTPLRAYRSDLIASSLTAIVGGFVVGVAEGTTSLSRVPALEALLRGTTTGLITTLLFWLAGNMVSAVHLSEVVLWITHRRRVHFMRLLEDALKRRVLRQAGAVYQFRHAALGEHLVAEARRTKP